MDESGLDEPPGDKNNTHTEKAIDKNIASFDDEKANDTNREPMQDIGSERARP